MPSSSVLEIPAFAEKSPTSPHVEGKAVTLRISDVDIQMLERGKEVRRASRGRERV
jgi:hypothetical protein